MKRAGGVCVVVVVLALAGCGGGGSSGPDYYKTMSKLGEAFAGQLDKLQNQIGAQTSLPALVAPLASIEQITATTLKSVRALTPPAKSKAKQEKLIAELTQFEGVMTDFINAARTNNATRVNADTTAYAKVGQTIPNTFLDISLDSPS